MTAPKAITGIIVTTTDPDAYLTAEAHGTTMLIKSSDGKSFFTLNESAAEEFAAEVAEAIAAIKGNARVSYIGRASSGETLETNDLAVAGRWAFERAQAGNVVELDEIRASKSL
ncbi:hypothetical protein DDK07_07635 [Mycobacteroides abscessus]|uniref:hypothetical protein n=1 Tax=Mycobacteroides abscessus TaxID=36809 RepID=UPI000C2688B0|nr:hypothetical protein [Mycobacteroides abscessus]MDO3023456.1 hypothetical protein [Mycobacteroides abscessus subsp. abscessus]PVB51135.1 hypothetical protein DDK07_07635 [Mycobacteroides abscessus]RIR80131.1 hypothetical protein D2E68_03815 [Mycobacteroides abscessus]RIT30025.1 hypothetical protein D2E73_00790 [Mycobacteroides abscessus]RIT38053.1 hypothetical protein D2E99_00790 [Mycobacteroides abscessus]